MKYLLFLALLIISSFACESNEIELTIFKHYTIYAGEESFDLWNGAVDTGTKLLGVTATSSDGYTDQTWTVCSTSGLHTLVLIDSYGDGWGSSYYTTYMTVSMGGLEIGRFTMPYQSGQSYKTDTKTFTPTLDVPFGGSWKYSDVSQSGTGWAASTYSDSSWSTATGASFPAFTATTRYYRTTRTISSRDSFASIMNSVKTGEGVAVYIQGVEVYRYKLPTGTLTGQTVSTSVTDSTIVNKVFSYNKFLLPTSGSYTIAIEIHQYTAGATGNDIFDFGAVLSSPTTIGECSSNLFRNGVATASVDSASASSYGPNKVFDGDSGSYYYTTGGSAVTFTFTFNNGKSVWANSYMIVSAGTTSYGHPSSWKVYGSQDGNTWDFLDTRENIIFSTTREAKQFYLRSNEKSYGYWKLEVLTSTVSGKLAVGRFDILNCNYASLLTGLQYEQNSYSYYANIDTLSIAPVSNAYITYTVSPALPTGLSLSATTGVISGMATAAGTGTYTISAVKYGTSETSTFAITFTFNSCGAPSSTQVRFRKVSTNYATEESWVVKNSAGTTVYTSPTLTSNSEQSFIVCLPAAVYDITVADSYGDGWSSGAMLYIEYFDYEGSYYTAGALYEYKSVDNTYTFDMSYVVPPASTSWTYIQGSVPSQWYSQLSSGTGFSSFPIASPPTATSTIWLFRHTFSVSSLSACTSAEVRVKARAGYKIYVNDYLVYSKNLPSSDITTTTTATGGDATSTFRYITIAATNLVEGSNILAIGIVNLAGNNPTTLLFDASIQLIRPNKLGRNWGLTLSDSPSGSYSVSNLIDMDYSTYWKVAPASLASASVTFAYATGRAEFVNKYCVVSSSLVYAKDPSDWAVYGSNDVGVSWTLLGNVTNAYFSDRKTERCFYLPENADSWNQYKFLFTEPAVPSADPYEFAIAEMTLSAINLNTIQVPALSFSSTTFTGYVGVPFPEVTPSSSLWGNFGIRPALSLPLEIDTSTGSIRGTPNTVIPSSTYVITAYDPLGMQGTAMITLSVSLCQAPKILFSVLIHSGTAGNEQGFTLYNKNGVQLMTKTGFTNGQDSYFPFCEDADVYSLKVTDSGGDGWDTGYFRILLEDNSLILGGSLGNGESEKTFPISVGYVIPPVNTEWKYLNSGSAASSGWNTVSFSDTTWKQAMPSAFESAVGNTQYFRKTFTISSLDSYASAVFNIKTKYGIVVYINGEEQYRYNMPTGTVSYNTYASSEKSESSYVGSSMSISFGNIINGNNVLAIEVHRTASSTSTVIDFDANLLVTAENSYRVIDGVGSSDDTSDDSLVTNAFDNILGSVYVSSLPRCSGATPTWTYNNDRKEYISSYTVVTGPKCNTRHPSDWEFQGSNDGVNWSTLNRVETKKFTSYSESYTVDFFNNKVYNSYRMKVTGCTNSAISSSTSYEGTTCDVTSAGQGFQIAELGLYTKRITAACQPDEANGWGGALNGDYAYKNCPSYYQGRIQALCTNSVKGSEEKYCTVMAPQRIRYSTKMMNVYKGVAFSYVPQVSAAEYTCSADATLPNGISLDSATGTISGTASEIFASTTFVITCTNTAGSTNTEVYISSTEKPGLPIYAWIIIGILAVIILGVVILCILNRTKSRKNKGHSNLDKKISTKGKSASKKGDNNAAKTVKV
ncbi:hypothetical protein WA158_007503 [Blastocystis sp. Blastoise]